MKKTISINLAGLVYQIDEDAFNLLESYLEKIKNTFTKQEEQEEIINDIEHRFAELFSEKLGKGTEVVTLKMVEEAIKTLGDVETIDEENQETTNVRTNYNKLPRKLFRSTEDKIFAGVLGGLGVYLDVDAIWLRLIFVLLAIASIGVPVGIIYIVLWVVMPKAETASQKMQMHGEPVNLSNFQENIKKNFNSENLKQTGNRLANSLGEIFKLSAKTFALAIGAFIFFNIVLFSFAWFFSALFINFIGGEYLGLIFNNNWQFIVLCISVFFLFAIPSLFVLYLLYSVVKKHRISWGKSFTMATILWFLTLLITMIIVFNNLRNFKGEATVKNYIDLPLRDSIQELTIEFDESILSDNFNFSYNEGNWETSGFEYNESNKTLKLNTVFLQIEASENDRLTLLASANARGKNIKDAQTFLDNFTYQIEVKNENTLLIPATLILENEDKFRFQTLTYILNVPIGTKIKFDKNAYKYLKNIVLRNGKKKMDLVSNTWLITINGLECLTCTEGNLESNAENEE